MNVIAGNRVYGRKRLIEQQNLRTLHHGATESHTLLLPAAELVWIVLQQRAVQVSECQQFLKAGRGVRRWPVGHLRGEDDVLAGIHMRKQARALHRIPHTTTQLGELRVIQGLAKSQQLTAVGLEQPITKPQECGLPAAAGAHYSGGCADRKTQIYIAQYDPIAVNLTHANQGQSPGISAHFEPAR
ncbi:MAG: hypothetical protein ACI87W_003495 [Halieaceae bacterium]